MVDFDLSNDTLGLAGLRHKLFNRRNNLFDFTMAEFDRVNNELFAHFFRSALHHHDAVLGADDHDVQRALMTLRIGGIDNELIVHTAHAHRANRSAERDIRERERRAGAIDADDIRIVFLIRREDERDDLRLVAEAFRKERADGTVDLPRGQDLFLAGTSFALDEAAGDAAAGVGVLAVIHGEGKEIDAFARLLQMQPR